VANTVGYYGKKFYDTVTWC